MLRRYHSIQDLVRDLRRVKKSSRLLLAADEDDPLKHEINQRSDPSKLKPLSERFKPGKMSREQQRGISRESKRFASLLEQQNAINNIIYSLNTQFSSETYPQLERMQQLAKRISTSIADKIEETKEAASDSARDTAPQVLIRLANNVSKKLDELLSHRYGRREIVNLAGMVRPAGGDETVPQHTVYLVYHDLKNDAGQISAQNVFAVSLLSNKVYINPALHTVKVPGQFRLGFEVKMQPELARMTNEVLTRISAQLEADEHLAQHNALPIPVDVNRLKLSNIHAAIVRTRMKNNVLQVEINKSIGKEKGAMEVVNQIYRVLYSAAITAMPKVRINRALKKTRDGWLAQFTFLPTGKLSGRTVDRDMVDKLRNLGLFDNEIRQIRHILET